jgi:hypothetical protein
MIMIGIPPNSFAHNSQIVFVICWYWYDLSWRTLENNQGSYQSQLSLRSFDIILLIGQFYNRR